MPLAVITENGEAGGTTQHGIRGGCTGRDVSVEWERVNEGIGNGGGGRRVGVQQKESKRVVSLPTTLGKEKA